MVSFLSIFKGSILHFKMEEIKLKHQLAIHVTNLLLTTTFSFQI